MLYLCVVLVITAGSATGLGKREADLLEAANGAQKLVVLLVLMPR